MHALLISLLVAANLASPAKVEDLFYSELQRRIHVCSNLLRDIDLALSEPREDAESETAVMKARGRVALQLFDRDAVKRWDKRRGGDQNLGLFGGRFKKLFEVQDGTIKRFEIERMLRRFRDASTLITQQPDGSSVKLPSGVSVSVQKGMLINLISKTPESLDLFPWKFHAFIGLLLRSSTEVARDALEEWIEEINNQDPNEIHFSDEDDDDVHLVDTADPFAYFTMYLNEQVFSSHGGYPIQYTELIDEVFVYSATFTMRTKKNSFHFLRSIFEKAPPGAEPYLLDALLLIERVAYVYPADAFELGDEVFKLLHHRDAQVRSMAARVSLTLYVQWMLLAGVQRSSIKFPFQNFRREDLMSVIEVDPQAPFQADIARGVILETQKLLSSNPTMTPVEALIAAAEKLEAGTLENIVASKVIFSVRSFLFKMDGMAKYYRGLKERLGLRSPD